MSNAAPPENSDSEQPPRVLAYENPREVAAEQEEQSVFPLWKHGEVGSIQDNAWSFCVAGSVWYLLLSPTTFEQDLWQLWLFYFIIVAIMAIGVGCAIVCIRRPELRRQERRKWLGGLIAVSIALGMTFNIQSCPHATYLRAGPVFVSIRGTRCANDQPLRFWWMLQRR